MSADRLLEHEACAEFPELAKVLAAVLRNVERASSVANTYTKTT